MKLLENIKLHEIEFMTLLDMVKTDWEGTTKDLSNNELMEDRNKWVKERGMSDEDDDEIKQNIDIHTISICLEQLRRFGGIVYELDDDKNLDSV